MKRNMLAVILSYVCAAALLSGCGSGGAANAPAGEAESGAPQTEAPAESAEEDAEVPAKEGGAGESAPADGVVIEAVANEGQFDGEELSILVSAGWMDSRYDAVIARFEETYGVTVDLQTIPADQYSDILQSDLANGTCPDVFWIQSNPFAISSVIVDPENYCIDFTGEAWEAVMPKARLSSCTSDGKLYGLQIWHNSPEYVMLYNKTLFEELGINKTPSTYEELKADCKIIAEAGITPWFMPGADGWQHQLAFFQIGGSYEAQQPGLYEALNSNKAVFAGNEGMLTVLKEFKELSDLGYFGEDWIGTDSTNMSNEFGDRTCAMAMANSSYIQQIKEDTGTGDEFGLFLIPLNDNDCYPTNPAGPTMFGYKSTPHEDLVRAFFTFLCTPESLQEILDNSPGYTNLDVNTVIEQHWLPEEEEFMASVDKAKMETPVLQTGTKYTNDYWMNFGADMVAYCQGTMEADEVLSNMDARRAEAAATADDPAWK
ncbi:ABC transporter substrate-binding protein [Lachnoclostridium sp. Marseille-P6806]|uniref:ABC transporter substrate-binding protein n=1 Tax=Lachnoclostridium sp. Marseille-P6806 TaxID=2364793 RepID=UPI0010308B58|nr:ABC transporter substrate-binding protein [Lachnoclostridium sp. Marseille-P6806]